MYSIIPIWNHEIWQVKWHKIHVLSFHETWHVSYLMHEIRQASKLSAKNILLCFLYTPDFNNAILQPRVISTLKICSCVCLTTKGFLSLEIMILKSLRKIVFVLIILDFKTDQKIRCVNRPLLIVSYLYDFVTKWRWKYSFNNII